MTVNKFPDNLGINLAQGAPSGALVYPDKFNSDMMTSYFTQMFGDGISNSYGKRDVIENSGGIVDWTTNKVQQFRNLEIVDTIITGTGPFICVGVQEKLIIRATPGLVGINLLGNDSVNGTRVGAIGKGGDGGDGEGSSGQSAVGGKVSSGGVGNYGAWDGGDGNGSAGSGGGCTFPLSLAGGGGGGGRGRGTSDQPAGGGGGGIGGDGSGGTGRFGGDGYNSRPANDFLQISSSILSPTPRNRVINKGGVIGWGGGGGGGSRSALGSERRPGGGGGGGGGIYIEANEIEIDPALIAATLFDVSGGVGGRGEGTTGTADGGGGGGGGGGSVFIFCNGCNITINQLFVLMYVAGGLGAVAGTADGGDGGIGTKAVYKMVGV